MIPQTTSNSADLTSPRTSRTENRADVMRVLLAIGLLALLASFDDAGTSKASAETSATIADSSAGSSR